MRKVVLHIGRHKTGTTSIQQFLCQNRSMLLDYGFVYPEFGIRGFGHHELGTPLTRSSLARSTEDVDATVAWLREHLLDSVPADNTVIVISSESFQNCDPKVVRKLFQGFDVDVIVYIREQVKYLVSAYAQKVQSTDYCGSMEDFFQQTSHSTYKEFLEKWDTAFDAKLCVKNYDRQALVGGDVVLDFCQTLLGIDGHVVQTHCVQTDANPSLTRDLLDFKLWVNRHLNLSASDSRVLFNAMSRLALLDESGEIHIPAELANKVARRYQQSNRYVAKKYFNRRKLFQPYKSARTDNISASLETRIDSVRTRLVSSVPELDQILRDGSG